MFIPSGTPRQNSSFSTIELKSSDGASWLDAFILDIRKRLSGGVSLQSSYTLSKSVDTTQASTFFSDATNGTTSAMPEYLEGYNKGPSDFDTRHNWVLAFTWNLPEARRAPPVVRAIVGGWQAAGIWTMRSGQPLTVFVTANRSRSQWNPSRGPGIGQDRPSYAPGYGPHNAVNGTPERWFTPEAFVLQPAGTFGNTGRGDLVGPNLRTLNLSLSRSVPWTALGRQTRAGFRIEAFNLLNRTNFGIPELRAFAGQTDGEAPLATFGRSTAPEDRLPLGELAQECRVVAADFREAVERGFRARREREPDGHVRAGRLAIEHEEVVVVDRRRDGLRANVLEPVIEHEPVGSEAKGLSVDVAVPGRVPQLVGEVDAVLAGADGPFAAVDDLVGAESPYAASSGFRTAPTPIRTKVPASLPRSRAPRRWSGTLRPVP